MGSWLLAGGTLVYAALLTLLAGWGDRGGAVRLSDRLRGIVYALSLAVYATSWTYFGAVGTAAAEGWDYLPIYLGPLILITAGLPLLKRLVRAAKAHNASSLADFLSARYGKSRGVAAAVTLIALIGTLPYIALQLKSVAASFAWAAGAQSGVQSGVQTGAAAGDGVLLVALALAGFAILFGTRQADMTAANRGMVLAVAAESVLKLIALAAVAGFALTRLGAPGALPAPQADPFGSLAFDDRFVTLTFLAMAALMCLPRQFHIMAVEADTADQLRPARWLFGGYLAAISLLVVPITLAGLSILPAGTPPDLYVLALPLAGGADGLAFFVFLGGFSAATGMVVVASLALSNMVASHLISPWLLARGAEQRRPLARTLLIARRLTILGLMLLAYLFQLGIQRGETLAELGVLAFAAMAQFLPAILGALFWRKAHRTGVLAGLGLGFGLWVWLLMAPAYCGAAPAAMAGLDPLTLGVAVSLGANALAFVLGSVLARPRLVDRVQAAAFVGHAGPRRADLGPLAARVKAGDVRALLDRCLGRETATQAISAYSLVSGLPPADGDPADIPLLRFAETQLARSIGASSARVLIASLAQDRHLPLEEVVSLIDETSQKLQFSRELLQATLEHLSTGVSVIDAEMRLVAWNSAYLKLFDYPAGLICVGRPVADLIRHNAAKGALGPGEVDDQVAKRLAHMRAGTAHSFERERPDGRVIRLEGRPMPGGGYVTSFTDVTEDKRKERALQDAKATLETRVAERTEALAAAKQEAERATRSKTRFLAAASHDLLQPLNAARLFTAAMDEAMGADRSASAGALLARVDKAIASADTLLKALLDISRLDAGGLKPVPSRFCLEPLLQELADQGQPIAAARGVRLRLCRSSAWVETDRNLLLSILQNFLSNALRYTETGTVLLGCRRRAGDRIEIQVLDTGPGIPDDKRRAIFEEFTRLDGASRQDARAGDRGLGLGLAICERIARLLQLDLSLRSEPGRGSVFSVTLPRSAARPSADLVRLPARRPGRFDGVRILCLDDDDDVLEALGSLLSRWGATPLLASSAPAAEALCGADAPDLILADYHLGADGTGLDCVTALAARWGHTPPTVLITAEGIDAARRLAAAAGVQLLPKPVPPAALRALISSLTALAAE